MRKTIFIKNQIYHVYNRGVEKRKIFGDNKDYLRFLHDLFEFNDESPAASSNVRFFLRQPSSATDNHIKQCLETRPPNIKNKRKPLVEILAFCLMPNHFHLVLRQKKENGVPLFMKKLGGGYAMYFNEKYQRVGSLFQGRFKAIAVADEAYFLQLSRYVHLNPAGLAERGWKDKGIGDWRKVGEFLENYRWSSYLDYIGKKNFPSLTSREFLLEMFGGNPVEYGKFVREWLPGDLNRLGDIALE